MWYTLMQQCQKWNKKSLLFKKIKVENQPINHLFGRDERIRTSDFLHPMQALYQAELRPVKSLYIPNFRSLQDFFILATDFF